MIRNYFKTALRNLWRNKVHTIINIFGLSVGITTCILILLFVKDELTFDQFHTNSDRIYRAWVFEDYGEDEQFFNSITPIILGPSVKENIGGIEHFSRFGFFNSLIRKEEDSFNERVNLATDSFFEIFDFKVLNGQIDGALTELNDVVITETIAKKYFGEVDPIGKRLQIKVADEFRDYYVKAVLEDVPSNSSIQFDLLISDLNNKLLYGERQRNSWTNVNVETYFLLEPGKSKEDVEANFPKMLQKEFGEEYVEGVYNIGLQPLTDIHLNTEIPAGMAPVSDPKYSWILSALAILILIVASINFMMLSVGKSINRAKEVGVRKVSGAKRTQLIYQFLGEAILVTLFALLVGILLSILNLPLFNELSGKELSLEPGLINVSAILGLTLLIGLISGSYPALVLSGFKPVSIFKGNVKVGKGKQRLRKSMVSFQFILSIFLIASTLVMKRQLDFMQEKNLGYNKEHVMVVQLNVPGGRLSEVIDNGFDLSQQFKNSLSSVPSIQQVGVASHTMGTGGWTNVGFTDLQDNYKTFNVNFVDEDYIPSLNIQIIKGRNFSEATSDKRRALIVNEAFVEFFGWDNPLGKKIPGKNFMDHEIIGVVKDFNYASLHNKVEPLALTMNPMVILSGIENIGIGTSPVPKLMVRINSGMIRKAIDQTKSVWEKIIPDEEFDFTFIDQTLAAQYRQEENLGKIVTIASILAVIIGSLGLLGLASLTIAGRLKEIGLRKVLGASEKNILMLLSKDYVYLVFISLLIASPFTYYFMNKWLQNFEYKIEIGPGIFLIAGGIALLIAIFTISFQSVKAAFTKPVETLKYE